ncbi:hypothetical protein ASPWEDRAFT_612339 [Aspergillus wentii DTO 134E9]|uniref:Uncharacterized protein n=1 Tax=Aspergillus wentii DTO 134E9 TaxID=1073089 RepID=A0A1L9RE92_ASPWE|nr:uncharacterized protein ASPWEDRAFT_612339 [Aspergillus wentii DTO 134E9]OJJ33183.1 hypothetical protein ASPWEDRAFT_612339 [Aspergillus wentii DTO 134E9]
MTRQDNNDHGDPSCFACPSPLYIHTYTHPTLSAHASGQMSIKLVLSPMRGRSSVPLPQPPVNQGTKRKRKNKIKILIALPLHLASRFAGCGNGDGDDGDDGNADPISSFLFFVGNVLCFPCRKCFLQSNKPVCPGLFLLRYLSTPASLQPPNAFPDSSCSCRAARSVIVWSQHLKRTGCA